VVRHVEELAPVQWVAGQLEQGLHTQPAVHAEGPGLYEVPVLLEGLE
jgi:hypothetical protein